MEVQPVSADVVSFLWMGQTWSLFFDGSIPLSYAHASTEEKQRSFRAALDAADIRGAYYESSTEGDSSTAGRQYYRTCQVDLGGGEKAKIRSVISEVFHNLAMRRREP